VPAAYQHLHGRITDLEAANQLLRTENCEIVDRADTYAQVIRELTSMVESLRRAHSLRPDNVRSLSIHSQPTRA
jgi:hypothetical protein